MKGAKHGLGGQLMAKKVTPELACIRGIPSGIDLRSPSRHPDILGGDDLLIKVEEMREATGYRLPVSVKLGAGRVSDDVKIAVKDGFDFIELDGMQGSTGAGSAEVIDYVGVPTLPAIIEAIDALEEIGRRQDIEIVLMGGIRDGVDAVKALCLGADAVAFGTSTIIAEGCGDRGAGSGRAIAPFPLPELVSTPRRAAGRAVSESPAHHPGTGRTPGDRLPVTATPAGLRP